MILTEDNMMEIDDKYSMEDFAAEMAAISDHDNQEDELEFPGFCRPACTARNIKGEEEEEEEEEDRPLYNIEALTSEADAMMSSPSKVSNNFQQAKTRMILRTTLRKLQSPGRLQ